MSEEQRDLGQLLDRLATVLEERALHAWTRSPESFFDELDNLNWCSNSESESAGRHPDDDTGNCRNPVLFATMLGIFASGNYI